MMQLCKQSMHPDPACRFAAVTLVLICLILSGSPARAKAAISVAPLDPLMDQRLDISISGLKPNAGIKVSARSQAQDGLWWRSEAIFAVDARGSIDLNRQAPLSGSYRGIDGMGLFWSMRPDDAPQSADHITFAVGDFSKPIVTTIEVSGTHGVIVSTTVARRYASQGVRSHAIRDEVAGTLYELDGGAPKPGVLVIGGSDAGPGEPGLAMLLASHGFAALSLSYFGAKRLPATLERIPMEYFDRAIAWMCRAPDIDSRFIAIYSESRGTEPGLFTAASDPRVSAVVARSPSFVLWGGVTALHLPGDAAWTVKGRPLPYIANTLYPDFILTYLWDRATGSSVRQTPLFLENLARAGDTAWAEIPVERIRGPVLLLSGTDDQIWPSSMMSDKIMSRLRRHAHAYSDQAIAYPGVGHPIPFTYLPTRGRWEDSPFAVGGTAEGMAKAQAGAWAKILKFLSSAAARRR